MTNDNLPKKTESMFYSTQDMLKKYGITRPTLERYLKTDDDFPKPYTKIRRWKKWLKKDVDNHLKNQG